MINKINDLFEQTYFLTALSLLSILFLYGMGLRPDTTMLKPMSEAITLIGALALPYLFYKK